MGVGYNAKKVDIFHPIVWQRPSSLVCFFHLLFITLLAMNLVSLGPTGAFAAKSPARQALEQGQEALRSGNIAGARAEFEKAVRHAPNDAEAQSALGWVLAQQGEPDAAVTHLRAAIQSKPGFG